MIKNQVDVTAVVQPRQVIFCRGQSEKEKNDEEVGRDIQCIRFIFPKVGQSMDKSFLHMTWRTTF
jgi:hypothetical protein